MTTILEFFKHSLHLIYYTAGSRTTQIVYRTLGTRLNTIPILYSFNVETMLEVKLCKIRYFFIIKCTRVLHILVLPFLNTISKNQCAMQQTYL